MQMIDKCKFKNKENKTQIKIRFVSEPRRVTLSNWPHQYKITMFISNNREMPKYLHNLPLWFRQRLNIVIISVTICRRTSSLRFTPYIRYFLLLVNTLPTGEAIVVKALIMLHLEIIFKISRSHSTFFLLPVIHDTNKLISGQESAHRKILKESFQA